MGNEALTSEAAPQKRRPGRPSGAHGEQARAQLLDIALDLFARQGIGETTLGAIAREAGVTPAMVHYYFKTRDQLLDMLIDERLVPLRVELARVFNDPDTEPVDTLRAFVETLVETVEKYPWFAALWVREMISEGGLLRQRMVERFGDAHKDHAIERIAGWQKAGKLNPALEPSLVFASLFGLTVFPLATTRFRSEGDGAVTPEQLGRHVIALLMNGIQPY